MDQQGFFPDGVPVRVGSVELRVGDDTGLLLNTPTGMLLGRGGQLFIVDGGERQVYVLDGTTGEPVAQFGHGGEGPGALVSPNTIGEDAQGRLWVNGWRWTSVFGPEDQGFGPVGRVDRVERLPPLDILSIPVPHGEGMRIAGVQMQLENDLSEIPRSTLSMVDVSMAEDGIDSEASVAWALDPVSDSIVEAIEIVHADDQRRRFARAPVFGATVVLRAHAPDGRVAQAGGGLYRIRIVSPDGLPAGEVEGPELPAVPLSPVEEERHVEQFAAFDGPESRLRAIDIYTPSHKQPIRNIAFDGANRLWVLLSVPDDSPFDVAHVFSPDGQMSEVVVWPQGISLLGTNRRPYRAIGDDFAWGIERDDLDVSSVVRLGFRTLSGEELAEMTSMLGMP